MHKGLKGSVKQGLKQGQFDKALITTRARGAKDGLDAEIEELKKVKDLINHDFLIIHVQPGDPKAEKLCIMAEKTGENESRMAGIYVEYMRREEENRVYHDGLHLYEIQCKTTPFKGLESIIDLLTKAKADYNVRDANCWDYARNTTEWILKQCIERASSAQEKVRLQTEHDRLETNLRTAHIIDTAKRFRDWLSSLVSRK